VIKGANIFGAVYQGMIFLLVHQEVMV